MKDLRTGGLAKGALASTVTGDGSNGSPFVAPCANPGLVDCTVTAFKTRLPDGSVGERVLTRDPHRGVSAGFDQ